MLSTVLRAGQSSLRVASRQAVRGYHIQTAFRLSQSLLRATSSRSPVITRGLATAEPTATPPAADKAIPISKSVYIGNIPWGKTEEDVKTFFAEWGKIAHVHLGKDANGRSKGFVHVTFENLFDAKELKTSSDEEPFVWNGRSLVINYAKDKFFSGTRGAPAPKGNIVRFTNFTQHRAALEELLTDFSHEIVRIIFLRSETGERSDRGFITFRHADIAEEAINTLKNTPLVDGRKLHLEYALPRPERPKSTARPRRTDGEERKERTPENDQQ